MIRVVVYGNCQAGPIGRLIERAAPRLDVVRAPPVHTIRKEQIPDVEDLFRSADIVLSQPIGPSFGALSSEALRALPGSRLWIEYPSIYFGGLFPYLHYLRQDTGEPLKGPLSDYHDRRIVRAFLTGMSEAECAGAICTRDTKLCTQHFASAVKESVSREEGLPIKVMIYVMDHFKAERLFHTFNHPTNTILWQVVVQFLKLIEVQFQSDARPPVNQFLNEISAAIPPEMGDAVGLEFVENDYRRSGGVIQFNKLISDFYRLYAATPDFGAVCLRNRIT